MNNLANPSSTFRQPPLHRHPMSGSNSFKFDKTTVSATNIESLPDELLFDILARLPAEFLLHISRLVCRKWRRIILSDAFADRQIQHSDYGLLVSSSKYMINCRHSFYAAATQGRIETTHYSSRTLNSLHVIGCCNGLALELHDDSINSNGRTLKSLHVMNPLTKKSFLLPSFSVQNNTTFVYHLRCGIGYSAASMNYKVTLPYTYHLEGDYHLGLAILTVGVDKSWRHVELPGLLGDRRILHSPLTSEGFLHWWRDVHCLTLNVETEKFTASSIPNIDLHNRSCYTYLSTGRYLSVLVGGAGEFCWDIWEMQSGEWRKLEYKIDLEAQKEKLQQYATKNVIGSIPVAWVKYPEILVVLLFGYSWRNCIFYNRETHEINAMELHGLDRGDHGDFKAFVHRNSLVHVV